MAFLHIPNVSIKGLSACVPKEKEYIVDIYKWGNVEDFINTTGIKSRRKAPKEVTSSDLCFQAAEKLITDLKWDKKDIDAMVFVSQTPDYILPATSCLLQDKLGLSTSCYTLDISLGCSGWVYGLSVLASLMQSGFIKNGLLLAGDTPLKFCNQKDKSTYPLFGDAGTVTAIEYDTHSSGMDFLFNSDGKGFETIIVKDGAYRNPVNEKSLENKDFGNDIIRSGIDVELDGMDVFSFGITKAPKSVKELVSHLNIGIEDIDVFSFHQANKMMNEMIRKKLKLQEEKVPYSLEEFGNTSSSSIPLTLVTREAEQLRTKKLAHIACGFGVGLSWGSVYFETDKITVPDLIEL